MRKKKQKPTVEIKTRKITKPVIYVNVFKPPYVETRMVIYERPYLEIQIPLKQTYVKEE